MRSQQYRLEEKPLKTSRQVSPFNEYPMGVNKRTHAGRARLEDTFFGSRRDVRLGVDSQGFPEGSARCYSQFVREFHGPASN